MQIASLTLNTNRNKNDINEIDKKFDNYYNNEYIDNTISRMNRLINLFNSNLTNHIDKYTDDTRNVNFSDISVNKQNNVDQLKRIEELENNIDKNNK